MAVPVYIVNTSDATEVCIGGTKTTKEIALVGYSYPSAVPVKLVGMAIPNVIQVKIVDARFVVSGELLIEIPVTGGGFPQAALLDNFNRANGPLGANWVDDPQGFGASLVIANNQAAIPSAGVSFSSRRIEDFGPDCDVTVQLSGIPAPTDDTYAQYDICARASNSINMAYVFEVDIDQSGGTLQGVIFYLYCFDPSHAPFGYLQLATDTVMTVPTSTMKIGIRCAGSQISGWIAWDGVTWEQVLTATDTHHTGAGKIGLFGYDTLATVAFDNLSASTLA